MMMMSKWYRYARENWSQFAYEKIENHECNCTEDALYVVLYENKIPNCLEYDSFLFLSYNGGLEYNAATA